MTEAESADPAPKPLHRRLLGIAASVAIGLVGGIAAYYAHLPLPWMLGPLFITAVLALGGAPIEPIGKARMIGQIVVGSSLGLQLSTAVLLKLVVLSPLIVAMTIVSVALGMLSAVLLMRMSKIDSTSAFFATTPGGVVEMANQAARYNAQLEVISVVQVMRVAFIVIVAPLTVVSFSDGAAAQAAGLPSVGWDVFLGIVALAVLGGLLMRWLDLPSAWFLGPLFVAGAAAAFGLVTGRAPDLMLIAAQVLMGTSLGTQFRREFVTFLLPVMLAGVVVVGLSTFAHAAVGVALAYAIAQPVAAMVLAMVPGGMAEMVLTAKLLHLDAVLIMGFQLLRIIMVLVWCRPAYRLFLRLTGTKPPGGVPV